MEIESLETDDFQYMSPISVEDPYDSGLHKIDSKFKSEPEKSVLWNGHYITPEAVFEKIEQLALNTDSKTKDKIQNLVERLVKAGSGGFSENDKLILLKDIEVLSGVKKNDDGMILHMCAEKKGWLGKTAHKVSKFVKKHKVEIIVGLVIVATIVTVAVVVSGAAGVAAAGAALGGAGSDDNNTPNLKGSPTPNWKSPHPRLDTTTTILPTSSTFVTEGLMEPHWRIGGINGINNSLDEVAGHASYLRGFTPNYGVEWVYNHSNSAPIDLVEAGINYLGISPNTSILLQENWSTFHEQNKNNPDAKYLQFCHSAGAIHVKNGLIFSPQEIRDRVIVVAIAPAAVVPKEICYESFNYACPNDIVQYGELAFAGAFDSSECGISKGMETVLEHREQLVLLKSDPNAPESVHSFQNPAYGKKIKDHIDDYLSNYGECQ